MRLVLVLLLGFTALRGSAASLTLAWGASTDASAVGYRLYYGAVAGMYTNSVVVGDVLSGTVYGLNTGTTYYFAAVAYTSAGFESPYSNEVSYTVPASLPVPAPVTGFRALVAAIGRWFGSVV